ncbi:MAG: hypothetical protein ACOY93_21885 [Bacillota bacterium]
MGWKRRFVPLLAALLALAVLAGACGRSGGSGGDQGSELVFGFAPGEVEAVVVSWEPTLKRVPPPKRTADRARFAPLLEALGAITERAYPPDLLGPPVHITLELKGGKERQLELWGPYLADRDAEVLYGVPEGVFQALQEALEPLSPPPIGAPARLSGMITVGDLVRSLQEHGLEDARETGETISTLLFGAGSGSVVQVLGQPVQVYTLDSPAAAARAAALDPSEMPVEWVARPHFVAVGNLLVTVVVPEEEVARKIVAYLEMVRE